MEDYDDDEWNDPADGTTAFLIESWLEPNQSNIKSLWEWPDPEDIGLRIGISGVAGTGKKQFAEKLGSKLDLPVISGITRNAHSIFDLKTDKKSQWEDEMVLFLAQMWEQMEYDEFISAGTLIDVLAQCSMVADRLETRKAQILLRTLTNVSNTMCNNDYTVMFYVPLRTKPRRDNLRTTDMKFLREVDRRIRFYLDAFDLDYFPVTGPPKQLAAEAHDYLQQFGLLEARE